MAWRGVREESKEGRMALTCNPCVMAMHGMQTGGSTKHNRGLVEWCEFLCFAQFVRRATSDLLAGDRRANAPDKWRVPQ